MLIEKFKKKPDMLFVSMFWNMVFAFLPFNIFAGILAMVFKVPINVNGEPTHGIEGFLVVILMAPLSALALATIVWVCYSIGNYFLRFFIRLFK